MATLLSVLKSVGVWVLGFLAEFLWKKWVRSRELEQEQKEEAEKRKEEMKDKIEKLKEATTEEERKKAHEDILNS